MPTVGHGASQLSARCGHSLSAGKPTLGVRPSVWFPADGLRAFDILATSGSRRLVAAGVRIREIELSWRAASCWEFVAAYACLETSLGGSDT
jgi:hypothetical protein